MSDSPQQDSAGRVSPFENIRQTDEQGAEYWSARALAKILGYAKWDKFTNVIQRAKDICLLLRQDMPTHFADEKICVQIGSGQNASS